MFELTVIVLYGEFGITSHFRRLFPTPFISVPHTAVQLPVVPLPPFPSLISLSRLPAHWLITYHLDFPICLKGACLQIHDQNVATHELSQCADASGYMRKPQGPLTICHKSNQFAVAAEVFVA